MKKLWLSVSAALLMLALFASAGFAQAEPVSITGTVNAISLEDNLVTIQVTEGETVHLYSFAPPEGFDLATLSVGMEVTVNYTFAEDGVTPVVLEIVPVVVEPTPEPTVEPTPEPVSIHGVVIAVDELAGTLTLQVETPEGATEEVVIDLPEGFDFTTVAVGDTVAIEGTRAADGTLTITSVAITPADGEDDGEDGGAYCTTDKVHPVATAIAATYGVTYEEVMEWKCAGFGFGNIMLALQTGKVTELLPADILQMKQEQGGWGVLWHSLGIVKNPKHAQPPDDGEPTAEPTEEPVEGEPTEEPVVADGKQDKGEKDQKCNPNNPNKPCDPADDGDGSLLEPGDASPELDQPGAAHGNPHDKKPHPRGKKR
jgi:hypothetical protein